MTGDHELSTGTVTLARAKEIVGSGHLWIYAGFVLAVAGQPVAGDLVDVLLPNGRSSAHAQRRRENAPILPELQSSWLHSRIKNP